MRPPEFKGSKNFLRFDNTCNTCSSYFDKHMEERKDLMVKYRANMKNEEWNFIPKPPSKRLRFCTNF